MNKEQFIAYMNKKLAVIKEAERKDIIDEYINHIDMKVAEGNTEEEAIEAFGDIDEMVKEILDAYNIDPNQQRENNFDYKVNDFLDRMFEAFRHLLGNVTDMNAEHIIRLLFEVLLVLILLGIMRIPFGIIESLGSSLLRSLFGFGIGSTFGWMWRVLVNLIYVVIFIVVLVNIVRRRWYRFNMQSNKDIMDDFKESFNFQQAKEAVYRFTQGTTHTHAKNNPYTEEGESNQDESDHEAESKDTTKHTSHYDSQHSSYHASGYREDTTSILRMVLKIFGYLMMIPFIICMIALWCAFGFMIVMSIQGVTFIGFYFLVIGGMIGVGSVISLIDRLLCKGGKC